ncbi:hypothetical protein EDB80DRAFT_370715 [Ilyonectria destructans]|nr:hypothetical protein EDB80DRAFT_370715 [Ilyonectria destructans]
MSASKILALAAMLLAASPAVARTDIAGCTSSAGVATASNGGGLYATVIWYVPGTGELCEFLDCGGGRAPPKTTVPGCPSYKGTETYSPQYLDLKTSEAASAATELAEASETAVEDDTATITEAPSTTKAAGTKDKTTLSTSVVESEGEQTTASASEDKDTKTTAAASNSGSSSGDNAETTGSAGAATTPANSSSTAGAASMPTAGAIMGLMAGAAVYVGML